MGQCRVRYREGGRHVACRPRYHTWTRVTYPPAVPALSLRVVADSKNNIYGMQMNNDKNLDDRRQDPANVWYDFPTKGAAAGEGMSTPRTAVVVVYLTATSGDVRPENEEDYKWKAPTPWTVLIRQFDDKAYSGRPEWDNDLALR